MNIAEGLKAARERAGMSLDDVAYSAGMSFSDVRDFECGECYPSRSELIALSRVLDFAISWPMGNPDNSAIEIVLGEPYYLEEHGEAAEWRHGGEITRAQATRELLMPYVFSAHERVNAILETNKLVKKLSQMIDIVDRMTREASNG